MIELGTPHLRFETAGPIAWCWIDRPEARNALTPAMYRGIGRALQITTDDAELRALVLTATGDVFVPGGDMSSSPDDQEWPARVLPFSALRHSRVPVITAINGICQASGLLLAMLSDIAIASSTATFRAPELLRGFPDMWYAAILPAHVGVGRARELMLTGRRLDAAEALRIGLVERVVDPNELLAGATDAAYEVLETAPKARNAWRRAINDHYGVVDEMTQEIGAVGEEAREGFSAFLEKRRPTWAPAALRTP